MPTSADDERFLSTANGSFLSKQTLDGKFQLFQLFTLISQYLNLLQNTPGEIKIRIKKWNFGKSSFPRVLSHNAKFPTFSSPTFHPLENAPGTHAKKKGVNCEI